MAERKKIKALESFKAQARAYLKTAEGQQFMRDWEKRKKKKPKTPKKSKRRHVYSVYAGRTAGRLQAK